MKWILALLLLTSCGREPTAPTVRGICTWVVDTAHTADGTVIATTQAIVCIGVKPAPKWGQRP